MFMNSAPFFLPTAQTDPSVKEKKDWEVDMETMLQHTGVAKHYAEQFMDGMRKFKDEILREAKP